MNNLLLTLYLHILCCTHLNSNLNIIYSSQIVINNNVVGEWLLSTTFYTKKQRISNNEIKEEITAVKCNICPEIIFKADGTGSVKSENISISITAFNWKLKNNKLIIYNIHKNALIFTNGSYSINFINSSLGISQLEITDYKGNKQLFTKNN